MISLEVMEPSPAQLRVVAPEPAKLESGSTIVPVHDTDVYEGDYDITPKMAEQVLETANKVLMDDMTVRGVPVYKTKNASGGYTIYVADSLEG